MSLSEQSKFFSIMNSLGDNCVERFKWDICMCFNMLHEFLIYYSSSSYEVCLNNNETGIVKILSFNEAMYHRRWYSLETMLEFFY